MGYVYLLHFDQPLGDTSKPKGSAQHYLGWTDNLDKRLREHRLGQGSKITQAAIKRGFNLRLVEVVAGTRTTERQFKRRHNPKQYCPICNPSRECPGTNAGQKNQARITSIALGQSHASSISTAGTNE